MHPVGVMIVYHISKTVVVVYNLWVLKFSDFLDPIISPVVSSFLFSNSSSHTICCHQHHGVIGFFHCMYIKRDSIHCTFQSINMTNFFIFEVFYNFISRDVLRPVPSLLYQTSCIQTLFCNSISDFKTQNPLSSTNTFPECQKGLVSHKRIPVVLPISSNSLLPKFLGLSFPSLRSTPQMISQSAHPAS